MCVDGGNDGWGIGGWIDSGDFWDGILELGIRGRRRRRRVLVSDDYNKNNRLSTIHYL